MIPKYVRSILAIGGSAGEVLGNVYDTSEVPKWTAGWTPERFWNEYYPKHYSIASEEEFWLKNHPTPVIATKKGYISGVKVICLTNGQEATINGPMSGGVRAFPLFTADNKEIWAYVERAANVCIYKKGYWAQITSEEIFPATEGHYYIAGHYTNSRVGTHIMQLQRIDPFYAWKYRSKEAIELSTSHTVKDLAFLYIEREATEPEIVSWFGQRAYNQLVNNKQNQDGKHKSGQTVQVCDPASSNGQGEGCFQAPVQSRHRKISLTGYNPEHQTGPVTGTRKIRRP